MSSDRLQTLQNERVDVSKKLTNIKDVSAKDKKVTKKQSEEIDLLINRLDEIDNEETHLRKIDATIANIENKINVKGDEAVVDQSFTGKSPTMKLSNLRDINSKIKNSDSLSDFDVEKLALELKLRNYEVPGRASVIGNMLNQLPNNAKLHKAMLNDLGIATDAKGGFTVQQELSTMLIERMRAFGGLSQYADVYNSMNGKDMEFIRVDNTTQLATQVNENAANTETDPANFNRFTAASYKYSSNVIPISFELLDDTDFDLIGYISEALATRLGRLLADRHINGTGSSQAYGVLADAAVGKTGASGQVTTVTYDDLVDLINSIDIAYRNMQTTDGNQVSNGCKFVMRDATLNVIRKIKDTTGHALFIQNMSGFPTVNNYSVGNVFGHQVVVDNNVPAAAASAKSIIFGLLKNFKIKNVMRPEYNSIIKLTDSAYVRSAQYGYMMLTRQASRLADWSGDTVKVYQHPAS